MTKLKADGEKLDFDGLNQNGRKAIFPKLQEFLMDFFEEYRCQRQN